MPAIETNVNEGYGQLHIVDYVLLVYVVLRIVAFEIPYFSFKFLFNPFSEAVSNYPGSLRLHLIRTTNILLNSRLLRTLINTTSTTVLSSPRYSPVRQNLYDTLVSGPTFSGHWILQSSLTAPRPPSTSDVTIFFLHGGGYSTSQPSTYLVFLLRLAESILDKGLTVSIFALNYHLAPERTYPIQLNEARAAYSYLLDEMQVPGSNIVIAGDSAGGHLALSLLVSLHRDPLTTTNSAAIGSLVLLSPWLSLHHTPTTNADTDVLSAPFLRTTARRFLGTIDADAEDIKTSPLLEFLTPQPRTDWDAVLPDWIWISAGTNEVMFSDIASWTADLEETLGKERVRNGWKEGEVHDWQWLETVDKVKQARFLKKKGKCEDFEGVVEIGRVVAERVLLRR